MSPYTMNKIEEPMRCAVRFLECISDKDTTAAEALLNKDCILKDIDESNPPVSGSIGIKKHFDNLFLQYPHSRIAVTEVSNFPHKCIAVFKWYGLGTDPEKSAQYVGIFEVRNALIVSVDLFSKR